jgi:hypothetical protein
LERCSVGFLLWLVLDVVLSTVLELLFEVTRSFDSDRELRGIAVVWFALLGFGGGLLTGVLLPSRLLDPGVFPGVSLLVAPAAVGAVMQVVGGLLSRRARHVSHLATWYGGAAVGLGLASGRLVVLEFIHDVRGL